MKAASRVFVLSAFLMLAPLGASAASFTASPPPPDISHVKPPPSPPGHLSAASTTLPAGLPVIPGRAAQPDQNTNLEFGGGLDTFTVFVASVIFFILILLVGYGVRKQWPHLLPPLK